MKTVLIAKVIALLLATPIAINAQSKASASASVTIVSSSAGIVSDTYNNELATGSNEGSVAMSAGEITVSSSKNGLNVEEPTRIATFTILGGSHTYDVTVPTNPIALIKMNGKGVMKMSSFTIESGKNNKIDNSNETFKVGAVVSVNALQPPGFYTLNEAVEVTVNFN